MIKNNLDLESTEKIEQSRSDLKELMTSRRSTFPKQFSGEIIDDSVINEILELAHTAPNHKKTMPWRFLVYKGQALADLLNFKKEFYLHNTAPEKVKKTKLQAFEDRKTQVSHIIAIVAHKNERVNLPEWEEIAAVSCSVQNIYLALNAYGVVGYWSTGNLTDSQEIRTHLKLDTNEIFMGFMYLGISKLTIPPSRLEPIGERIKWISEK